MESLVKLALYTRRQVSAAYLGDSRSCCLVFLASFQSFQYTI